MMRLVSALILLLVTIAASPSSAAVPHRVAALRITVLSTMLADHDAFGEWRYSALVEIDGRKFLPSHTSP